MNQAPTTEKLKVLVGTNDKPRFNKKKGWDCVLSPLWLLFCSLGYVDIDRVTLWQQIMPLTVILAVNHIGFACFAVCVSQYLIILFITTDLYLMKKYSGFLVMT